MITKNQINNLPNTIGLYFFKNNKVINYIGKSVNIKARVLSHLENAKLDNKERLIIDNSNKIETIVTESEFKALILEAKLIREFQPKYNSIWKDDKSPLYVKITNNDEFPKIVITRKPSDKSLYFGPFSSVRMVEKIINDIRRIIPFCTQKKISKKACFYSKINLCDPCPNEINNCRDEACLVLKKQYKKNIKQVISILNGNVKEIINSLNHQLNILIRDEHYEEAIVIRNKIFRFNRLLSLKDDYDFSVNNNEKRIGKLLVILKKYFPKIKALNRIETYDISNLGLKQAVGSMVVMKDGQIDKKEYRKFKIKQFGLRSDFDRLKEVINRRLKQKWMFPDLIIIDGGKPQIKAILTVFEFNKISIPLVGIAKNPDRVIVGIEGYPNLFLKNDSSVLNVIRLMRDESHRFARKYHLFLRSKDFLI
ncbi:UvrABC system protein C [Candidatus Roizmanbacteria bacterium]|nr:UvrABC system protein C [Candidatus Roizmanbacteria bacterium]